MPTEYEQSAAQMDEADRLRHLKMCYYIDREIRLDAMNFGKVAWDAERRAQGGGRRTPEERRARRAAGARQRPLYVVPNWVPPEHQTEDVVTWAVTTWPDKFTPAQAHALAFTYLADIGATDAARIIGISPSAFRSRLRGADRALRVVCEAAWAGKAMSSVRRGANRGRALVTETAQPWDYPTTTTGAKRRQVRERRNVYAQDAPNRQPLFAYECPVLSCGRSLVADSESLLWGDVVEHFAVLHPHITVSLN